MPHEWAKQPWRYTLWTFRTFEEQDFVENWVQRVQRIDQAKLFAQAMIDPARLDQERQDALSDAMSSPERDTDLVQQAREAIERLERSGAMCDTPEEREAFYQRYRVS